MSPARLMWCGSLGCGRPPQPPASPSSGQRTSDCCVNTATAMVRSCILRRVCAGSRTSLFPPFRENHQGDQQKRASGERLDMAARSAEETFEALGVASVLPLVDRGGTIFRAMQHVSTPPTASTARAGDSAPLYFDAGRQRVFRPGAQELPDSHKQETLRQAPRLVLRLQGIGGRAITRLPLQLS